MADADDVLKNAGRLFSKLGGTLREAGKTVGKQLEETGKTVGKKLEQTGKQVTGLGRGAVKLELDQTRFAPGATIQGRLVLALTEPVEAKRLVVCLRARQRQIALKRGDSGGVGATHLDVYQLETELAPAQTFEAGTFPFELTVPPDALDLRPAPSTSTNPLADAVRTVASALAPDVGPVEWQVIGRLDIAWGRDLAREVDIVVAG